MIEALAFYNSITLRQKRVFLNRVYFLVWGEFLLLLCVEHNYVASQLRSLLTFRLVDGPVNMHLVPLAQ